MSPDVAARAWMTILAIILNGGCAIVMAEVAVWLETQPGWYNRLVTFFTLPLALVPAILVLVFLHPPEPVLFATFSFPMGASTYIVMYFGRRAFPYI